MPETRSTQPPGSGIFSRQPAIRWQDALPAGNGSLGALVYGNICRETILLNHENLWLRKPRPHLPDIPGALDETRKLLDEGRYTEAEGHLAKRLAEAGYLPRNHDTFHPAFKVTVSMATNGAFQDYSRSLDFETGEATVSWRDDSGRYRRDLIVSHADDAVYLNISGSAPFGARLSFEPHRPEDARGVSFDSAADNCWLRFAATYTEHADAYPGAPQYGGIGRVATDSGSVTCSGNAVVVEGAEDLLLSVKLFANEDAESAFGRLESEIDSHGDEYTPVRDRHAALHKEMFHRARIEIAQENAGESTDDLLRDANAGSVSDELMQTMMQYGRYLLISSSGPSGLPANLQGVWNGDWDPPWQSDYHMDENLQMNYWAALPGNLTEHLLPVLSLFEAHMDDYRENARKVYGCRGIVIPISQTTHGLMYIGSDRGPWPSWTGAAGWLAQHCYDYWRFTGDTEFLRNRAVPFMREAALFYSDFLIDDSDGRIKISPSLSPENVPAREGAGMVTINATMDVAIVRELLTNLLSALEFLGMDDPEADRWRDILNRLPKYETNTDGALREWLHPDFPDNYHHRHLSHLYPLFPGTEIGPESDPVLFDAARIATEKRLVIGLASQSGWSYAHLANTFARLGDGEAALQSLELLLRACTGPNLFTYHNDWRAQGLTVEWFDGSPPFQIDANFGFTAAVIEMLLSSTESAIRILPALPRRWNAGRVEGLLTRCCVQLSVEWDMAEGRIACSLKATDTTTVDIAFPLEVINAEILSGNGSLSTLTHGDRYVRASLPRGETVEMRISVEPDTQGPMS